MSKVTVTRHITEKLEANTFNFKVIANEFEVNILYKLGLIPTYQRLLCVSVADVPQLIEALTDIITEINKSKDGKNMTEHTESLIAALEAELPAGNAPESSYGYIRGHDDGINVAIEIIRQYQAQQPIDTKTPVCKHPEDKKIQTCTACSDAGGYGRSFVSSISNYTNLKMEGEKVSRQNYKFLLMLIALFVIINMFLVYG